LFRWNISFTAVTGDCQTSTPSVVSLFHYTILAIESHPLLVYIQPLLRLYQSIYWLHSCLGKTSLVYTEPIPSALECCFAITCFQHVSLQCIKDALLSLCCNSILAVHEMLSLRAQRSVRCERLSCRRLSPLQNCQSQLRTSRAAWNRTSKGQASASRTRKSTQAIIRKSSRATVCG